MKCLIEGCETPARIRMLCRSHYGKLRRAGEPLPPPQRSKRLTPWEKYERFVVRSDVGCWGWSGQTDKAGYARLSLGRSGRLAHRVAFELFIGPIPEGMTVDHICFTRSCTRPDHLQPLPHAENARRQRTALEERCPRGHLWAEDNVRTTKRGWRVCRACRIERSAAWRARKRTANP